jgi:nucleoside-diphosphate-sugar epimerase
MRVLVTGATGFIGRHLLARLTAVEEGTAYEVYGLVRRKPDAPLSGVTYVVQELTQPLDLARLPRQVDAIIHQAALIDADGVADRAMQKAGTGDDVLPFLANVVATWRLLRYAEQAGARHFIHASTGGVYGCGERPFVENDPFNPLDLYSLTKSQAELAVRHTPSSFPKIILRYFFPYGLGTPNPIPSYVQRAIRGEAVAIPANRKPRFNPIHINDAVEATVAALSLHEDATLNIAGSEITTFAEIVEFASQRANRQSQFEWLAEEDVIPYYRGDLVASIEAMQRTLGITPQVTLAQGLAALVDGYLGIGKASEERQA